MSSSFARLSPVKVEVIPLSPVLVYILRNPLGFDTSSLPPEDKFLDNLKVLRGTKLNKLVEVKLKCFSLFPP